jgi:hypothetical protein
VPDKQLTAAMEPVQDVVKAMGLATGLLCDCLNQAQGRSAAPLRSQQLKTCSDPDALLCILSHRADRVASKYLKEKQKMPKIDGKRKGLFF